MESEKIVEKNRLECFQCCFSARFRREVYVVRYFDLYFRGFENVIVNLCVLDFFYLYDFNDNILYMHI